MCKLPQLLGILAVCVFASGCDDACGNLSEEICRCESTQTGQQACLQRLSQRQAGVTVSEESLERCNELIDTCTCDALAKGDYAACGLSAE